MRITPKNMAKYLGIPRVPLRAKPRKRTRLVWRLPSRSPTLEGDILSVEVSVVKGKGKLTLTGQMGDVMKESAYAG